jgi:serine/threonine protein kinase
MNAVSKEPSRRPRPRAIGRYYLHEAIGAGGMGTVHLGWMIDDSRLVAIKALRAELAQDPDCATLFSDETRVALQIVHRNVVRALDVVHTEGQSFLVMEYVRGATLSQLVRCAASRGESVPPATAAGIAIGMLQGLHATHETIDERGAPLNLVHRDVSPQNVMVGTDGTSRLIDFGVAEAAGSLRTARPGALKGKIHYMAPEQLNYDGTVSRRTDVYAAAVVLWETVCGRKLFDDQLRGGATPAASGVHRACADAFVRRYGQIPAPSTLVSGVSCKLDDVVLRGLDPTPSKRFATAEAMACAIAASGPVASEEEIGAWVQSLGEPELEAREARVREVERSSGLHRLSRAELEAEAGAASYLRRGLM